MIRDNNHPQDTNCMINREPIFVRHGELMGGQYSPAWAIEGLFMQNESIVLGAEKKSYKTHLATDIGISIATGKPALGRFPVKNQGPVCAYFLEDRDIPRFNHQVRLICEAKCIDATEEKSMPLFRGHSRRGLRKHEVADLKTELRACGAKLLILDCITSGLDIDQTSQRDFYSKMQGIDEACQEIGCQLLAIHHCKHIRRSTSLDLLKGAGAAEYFRQWLILRKRTNYANGKLCMSLHVGGSAWSEHKYAINIDQLPSVDGIATQWRVFTSDVDKEPVGSDQSAQIKEREEITVNWLKNNSGLHSKTAVLRGAGGNRKAVSRILETHQEIERRDGKYGYLQQ